MRSILSLLKEREEVFFATANSTQTRNLRGKVGRRDLGVEKDEGGGMKVESRYNTAAKTISPPRHEGTKKHNFLIYRKGAKNAETGIFVFSALSAPRR